MASTKVRGITIELGGDTSGLEKAFGNVNRTINSTQNQLRDVERLLKLDPTNTELLAQKQQLLNSSVTEYANKLETLKKAQSEFDKSLYASDEEATKAQNALQREIAATQLKLDQATRSVADFGKAAEESKSKLSSMAEEAQSVADATSGISTAAQGMLAAVGAGVAGAVKEYADFEQNIGGIETFFKDSADVVREYANEAYKTAGLSANDYLETITGFAAALLKSMGGNTRAAAELANIAIIDMADNANKFGTDIASIQHAYQGFAKNNYNMLDNLKLGFAGTKDGMEQLLAEASRLTGTQFDINNFSDIVMAIHEVQTAMGVAGTTSKEAESTITGSVNTVNAAFQNLALGLADADADVDQLAADLQNSLGQALSNIVPVIIQIIDSLPGWAKFALLITSVAAVASPLASIISAISTALNAVSMVLPTATALFGGVSTAMAGTTAAAVAAAAAIGYVLSKLTEWRNAKLESYGIDPTTAPTNSDYGTPGFGGEDILTLTGSSAGATTSAAASGRGSQSSQAVQSAPVDVTLMIDRNVLAHTMVDPNARAVDLAGGSTIK